MSNDWVLEKLSEASATGRILSDTEMTLSIVADLRTEVFELKRLVRALLDVEKDRYMLMAKSTGLITNLSKE